MSTQARAEEAANTFRANYVPNAGLNSVEIGREHDHDDWFVRVGIDATCRVTIPDTITGVRIRTFWDDDGTQKIWR
jgi:hypothetical protein